MDQESLARGDRLLAPLGVERSQVFSVVLTRERFGDLATAKAWAKNHGIPVRQAITSAKNFVLVAREQGDFVSGEYTCHNLGRGIELSAGTLLYPETIPSVEKVVPASDASEEDKRAAQKGRAEQFGIEPLEGKGENLSFPAGDPTDLDLYGDPVNLKYPMADAAQAANARVRFKQNAGTYSKDSSKKVVHNRIVKRELALGISPSFDENDPLDAMLDQDLKDQMQKSQAQKFVSRGEIFVSKAETPDAEKEVRFFGIVMKPEVPDVEGDVTSAEEIARANDQFMREFHNMGMMHQFEVNDKVKILQNVIAPVDFEFPGTGKVIKTGTWYQELFSDDPEIVTRIRKGQLTGLSIGGTAKRVPIEETDANKVQKGNMEVTKSAPEGNQEVAKAEGDPARARFVDLVVQEVSVVDAAANEEVFFVIKRKKEEPTMNPPVAKTAPESAPVVEPAPAVAPEPVVAAAHAPEAAPVVETPVTKAEPVAEPVVAATPDAPAPQAASPDVAAVLEAVTKLGDRLNTEIAAINTKVEKLGEQVNGAVTEVTKKVESIEVPRAIAKGANEVAVETPEEPRPNLWAGTAVNRMRRPR